MTVSYGQGESDGTSDGVPSRPSLGFATKASAVAAILREEILAGVLPPGTPLQQNAIAERLSVSSTPVREALAMLQADGLVLMRPHRETIVVPAQPIRSFEARAIYEIRHTLERIALRRLTTGGEPSLLSAIEETVHKGDSARDDDNFVIYRYSLSEFHRLLCQGIGSELLGSALRPLNSQAQFFPSGLDRGGLDVSHRSHQQMLAAIRSGEVERVLALEDEHHQHNLKQVDITDFGATDREL